MTYPRGRLFRHRHILLDFWIFWSHLGTLRLLTILVLAQYSPINAFQAQKYVISFFIILQLIFLTSYTLLFNICFLAILIM